MNKNVKLKGKLWTLFHWPLILIIPLVLINIGAYINSAKVGLAVSVFLLIYLVCVGLFYLWGRKNILRQMVDFGTQYSTVQKELLDEFELPYALLDSAGKILWVNQQFSVLTGVLKNNHKSITTVFPSITREFIEKNPEATDLSLEHEGRAYRITMRRVWFDELLDGSNFIDARESGEFLVGIYLFDETMLKHYEKENVEQKQVSALVYIDNYEEALEGMEDVRRSMLIALIDRKVNQYFTNVDALVRKIEKDKYFIVFKYKYLQQLEEDKFSVLEDVKTVKAGNEIAVTLSIGVGIKGDDYNKNYDCARSAIDLALGRGGDQAVIKNYDKIHYYGGKAKQVERNTRVKARVKALALREMMEGRDNVLVMGHSISDVDCIGAGVGIYVAAKALGKKAQIVVNNPNASLRPLIASFSVDKGFPADMFIDSAQALEMVGRNTLVMVVDTNRPSYTECRDLLRRTDYICVFDHHRQSSEVIENPVLSYIEPYASSACEMVAEVLQYFQDGLRLETAEADCIYAGILIDTNNFNTKTGVRTFEAAAYLRRHGADVTRVRKMLRNDMAAYKAKAEAVRSAEVYRKDFAISICPADGLESPTIVCAQVADELLNIIGIKASFVVTEYNGRVYISARSIDEINVQIIMERLGGGGHLNVAGAQIANTNSAAVKRLIQETLDEMIREGDLNV